MRRARDEESTFQAYSDFLFNVVGVFILMATLSLLLLNPLAKKQDGIHPKAEYLIVLTWDDRRNVDLDLWLKHNDCVIMFRTKECVNMNLDRDSLGFKSNRQIIDHKEVLSPNQEIIAIRAVIPGDFIAAVNYFAGHDNETGIEYRTLKPDPDSAIDATVELYKVNPTVTSITKVNLHFDRVQQSFNAINFHVNEDGSVELRELPPEDMISQHLHVHSGGNFSAMP